MKNNIDSLLEDKNNIFSIMSYANLYIEENYQRVFEDHKEQLLHIFRQVGEPAYGAFGRILFQSLGDWLARYEIFGDTRLPGTLQNSLERWGPPEERERCLWTVLRNSDGLVLGSLVTRLFHDHTRFRLPHPPQVFALEETEAPAIQEKLFHSSIRITHGQEQRGAFLKTEHPETALVTDEVWEYSVETGLADNLECKRVELTTGQFDHALAVWGKYGWELTSVVPHQGQLIAFFKRPANRSHEL